MVYSAQLLQLVLASCLASISSWRLFDVQGRIRTHSQYRWRFSEPEKQHFSNATWQTSAGQHEMWSGHRKVCIFCVFIQLQIRRSTAYEYEYVVSRFPPWGRLVTPCDAVPSPHTHSSAYNFPSPTSSPCHPSLQNTINHVE